jgi:hypothetical protein
LQAFLFGIFKKVLALTPRRKDSKLKSIHKPTATLRHKGLLCYYVAQNFPSLYSSQRLPAPCECFFLEVPMSKMSLDKSKIKFLLLEGVHQSAVKTLNDQGYTNIEYLKTALGEEELIEKIHDVHFVGLRSRTQLTRRVFDNAPKLIAAGCFCIGTNQVDLKAAQEHGVAVFNAP